MCIFIFLFFSSLTTFLYYFDKSICHQAKFTTGLCTVPACFCQSNFSYPKTYFSEFDFLLVDRLGRGGAASAVHKPASISNQYHIWLLHRLRHTAGQCVPHLVLQVPSIGVDLKTDGMIFIRVCGHNLSKIKSAKNRALYLVAQKLARQSPEGVEVQETA